jgi:hypothetical protein
MQLGDRAARSVEHTTRLYLMTKLRKNRVIPALPIFPHGVNKDKVLLNYICGSVHHQSILLNNQRDAALSSRIY